MKPFRPPLLKKRPNPDPIERSATPDSDYQSKKQRIDENETIIPSTTAGARRPLDKILNQAVVPNKEEGRDNEVAQEAYYLVLW
jgi:hypothetical protein